MNNDDPVPHMWVLASIRANECASLSRRGGAPRLCSASDRDTLIAWLEWNDPNGSYDDEACDREGYDRLDLQHAWEIVAEMAEDA